MLLAVVIDSGGVAGDRYRRVYGRYRHLRGTADRGIVRLRRLIINRIRSGVGVKRRSVQLINALLRTEFHGRAGGSGNGNAVRLAVVIADNVGSGNDHRRFRYRQVRAGVNDAVIIAAGQRALQNSVGADVRARLAGKRAGQRIRADKAVHRIGQFRVVFSVDLRLCISVHRQSRGRYGKLHGSGFSARRDARGIRSGVHVAGINDFAGLGKTALRPASAPVNGSLDRRSVIGLPFREYRERLRRDVAFAIADAGRGDDVAARRVLPAVDVRKSDGRFAVGVAGDMVIGVIGSEISGRSLALHIFSPARGEGAAAGLHRHADGCPLGQPAGEGDRGAGGQINVAGVSVPGVSAYLRAA